MPISWINMSSSQAQQKNPADHGWLVPHSTQPPAGGTLFLRAWKHDLFAKQRRTKTEKSFPINMIRKG
jgi:hypothetical protein